MAHRIGDIVLNTSPRTQNTVAAVLDVRPDATDPGRIQILCVWPSTYSDGEARRWWCDPHHWAVLGDDGVLSLSGETFALWNQAPGLLARTPRTGRSHDRPTLAG